VEHAALDVRFVEEPDVRAEDRVLADVTPGLDPATRQDLVQRILRLSESKGFALIVISHELPDAASMATRTASSGVTSTFASPLTPSRPNRLRAPLLSQTMLLLTIAPSSIVLNGKILTLLVMSASVPTNTSSPSTTPSSMRTLLRMLQLRPTTAPRIRVRGPT